MLVFAAIFAAGLSPTYRALSSVPSHIAAPAGHRIDLGRLPGLTLGGPAADAQAVVAPPAGHAPAVVRLFGGPVVKRIDVRSRPARRVVVGGGAVGIDVPLRRPTVIGFVPEAQRPGGRSPAEEAGLRAGDRILAVGRVPVQRGLDLSAAVEEAGRHHRPVLVKLERHGRPLERRLAPVYDVRSGSYRIGVFVRDRLSGIGTMTFADPLSGRWAALGHPIQEPPSGVGGTLLQARVVGLRPGRRGTPGAKVGVVAPSLPEIGRVTRSTPVGVVGTLVLPPFGKIATVAEPDEVHVGPATLYTVLDRGGIEGFRVRIERRLHPRGHTSKALIVRVTDPDLLRRAGGIVQGMSGSPIMQDGRLVGAVTHVFVNDPTRGFAVYAAWMLDETDRQGG